jgi:alkylation response protein AidB-like acyl-CoA dehydrogenase
MGDHYLLNGAKCGFHQCLADIAVVWAKTKQEEIHGLIVERNGRFFYSGNS